MPFDLTPYMLFVQAIGLCGIGLSILSFSQSDDIKLKIYIGFAGLIMAVHFYLLGSLFGALAAAFAGIRFLISIKFNQRWMFYIMIIPSLLMLYFHEGDVMQYFPIVASVFGTIGAFLLKGIPMRYAFLCGQTCWMIHNIYYLSIGGILEQIMQLSINTKTILKMRKADKNTDAT
jgi:hypothetical protein